MISAFIVDFTSKEAIRAVRQMLFEPGRDATADEFGEELNILSHAVPAIHNDAKPSSTDLDAQLFIHDIRCFLAIKILEEQKKKYLSKQYILNQDLTLKIAAAGVEFDRDWKELEVWRVGRGERPSNLKSW